MSQIIIGCPVSAELAQRTREIIDRLRRAPEAVARGEVADLVADLTQASFDYHFVRPLSELGVGFATRKGIQVALGGTVRVIHKSMHQVLKSLDAGNYAKLADYIEQATFGGR
ncbi:MAG: hypothetical protein L0H83_15015 [Salinisphaera sp.]|nr:hypothetical protein [Salinisphaera sp.]